jgi:hypothetical protein
MSVAQLFKVHSSLKHVVFKIIIYNVRILAEHLIRMYFTTDRSLV